MTAALAETDALLLGFETEPCPQCTKLTQKRDGASLICATCGEKIVEISKRQWIRFIEHPWSDKRKVRELLIENIATMSREWPPAGVSISNMMLAEMGAEVERAKSPEECWNAFLKVLTYLACPEPGWHGVELRVIS